MYAYVFINIKTNIYICIYAEEFSRTPQKPLIEAASGEEQPLGKKKNSISPLVNLHTLDVVAEAYNPSTWEVEARGQGYKVIYIYAVSSRPA